MSKPVAWRWRWKESTTWILSHTQPDEHPNRLMQPLYGRDDYHYRGYIISYWMKPIPTRDNDWDWRHEDFDLDDQRYGSSGSLEAAMGEIDDQIEDEEYEAQMAKQLAPYRRPMRESEYDI